MAAAVERPRVQLAERRDRRDRSAHGQGPRLRRPLPQVLGMRDGAEARHEARRRREAERLYGSRGCQGEARLPLQSRGPQCQVSRERLDARARAARAHERHQVRPARDGRRRDDPERGARGHRYPAPGFQDRQDAPDPHRWWQAVQGVPQQRAAQRHRVVPQGAMALRASLGDRGAGPHDRAAFGAS